MRQTLLVIPHEVGGVPLFGAGIALAVWIVAAILLLAYIARRSGGLRDVLNQLPLVVLVGVVLWMLPRIFPQGVPIRGYGVMLLLAVSSGVGLAVYRAQRLGINPDLIFSIAFWLFLAGIGGARLFHVIQYWHREYAQPGYTWKQTLAAIANVPSGGLVIYGGMIGGAVAYLVFSYRHRISPLVMGDLIAPSLMLGLALGRIGCLLNGCCFGGSCSLPWAVEFPPESPPYAVQAIEGQLHLYGLVLPGEADAAPEVLEVMPDSPAAAAGIEAGDVIRGINGNAVKDAQDARYWLLAVARRGASEREEVTIHTQAAQPVALPAAPYPANSLSIHPTQLYSAVAALLLCLLLLAYFPFRRRDGEVTGLLLTLYPIQRFLLEVIRTDEGGQFATGLSISQLVSLTILIAAIGYWFFLLRRPEGSVLPRASAS